MPKTFSNASLVFFPSGSGSRSVATPGSIEAPADIPVTEPRVPRAVRARGELSGMLRRLLSSRRRYCPGAGGTRQTFQRINGANRGFRLRRMRQEAGLRQQRLALAPPHPPPLEPQHPDRSRYRVWHAEAPARLHLLHQGRQGLPLTPALPRPRGSGACDLASFWLAGPFVFASLF